MWDVSNDWHEIGIGDFNGDGRDDILWRHDSGTLTNWLGQTNGEFAFNYGNASDDVAISWHEVGTGDFNGDGRDDILWRHDSGMVTNWLGEPDGGFQPNNDNAWDEAAASWQVVGIGDFNGDGRDDVLWRNLDIVVITDWLATDGGGFVPNTANAWHDAPASWQIAGTGDFNGDGRDDVLWRHDSGALTNWLGQPAGGFASNNDNAWNNIETSWHVVGTGDFNGDGRDDILWRHHSGTLTNWLGQPNGGFAYNNSNAWDEVATSWHVAATGDFNGDGRDDVLWRNDIGTVADWLGQNDGGFDTSSIIGTIQPTAGYGTVFASTDLHGVRDQLGNLFTELDAALSSHAGGSDQNSYYPQGYDTAPWTFEFGENFGWSDAQREALGMYYFDYLNQNIDPELSVTGYGSSGFSTNFSGGTASFTPIGSDSFYLNINGFLLLATWHTGDSPSTGDEIVVNGRHLHYEVVGVVDPQQGTQASPPPTQGSSGWNGPDLTKVNPISGLVPPDGAQYYLPEGITDDYLIDALNYLSTFAQTHNAFQLLEEFKAMYQNPAHPHFIDFKVWGTDRGPPGVAPVEQIAYWSDALGREVSASPFEAFGNWFYGFAGRWAGISTDALLAAAAIMQEGQTGFPPTDSPEDRPHVGYGINSFANWEDTETTVFTVYLGNGN